MAEGAPTFNFFGLFQSTWASLYVIAVPLGAFLSVKSRKKFGIIFYSDEVFENFIGGAIMGIGAALSGGCNIGHGLTGASTLAISSILTTAFMILGNWTLFYFKYMRK